jgi:hypothetical protein
MSLGVFLDIKFFKMTVMKMKVMPPNDCVSTSRILDPPLLEYLDCLGL